MLFYLQKMMTASPITLILLVAVAHTFASPFRPIITNPNLNIEMIPLDTGLLYRPSPTILENVGRLNTGLLGAIPQLALSGAPDWFFPKLVALLRPFEPKTSVISGSLPCDTSKTLEYNMKSFTSTAGIEEGSDRISFNTTLLVTCTGNAGPSSTDKLFVVEMFQGGGAFRADTHDEDATTADDEDHTCTLCQDGVCSNGTDTCGVQDCCVYDQDGNSECSRSNCGSDSKAGIEGTFAMTRRFAFARSYDGRITNVYLPAEENPDQWAIRKALISPFQTKFSVSETVSMRNEDFPEMNVKSHYAAELLEPEDALLDVFPQASSIVYSASQPRDIKNFATGSNMNGNTDQYARDGAHVLDDKGQILFFEETMAHVSSLHPGRVPNNLKDETKLDKGDKLAATSNTFQQKRLELVTEHTHDSDATAEGVKFVHQFFGPISAGTSLANLTQTPLLNIYPKDFLDLTEFLRYMKLLQEECGSLEECLHALSQRSLKEGAKIMGYFAMVVKHEGSLRHVRDRLPGLSAVNRYLLNKANWNKATDTRVGGFLSTIITASPAVAASRVHRTLLETLPGSGMARIGLLNSFKMEASSVTADYFDFTLSRSSSGNPSEFVVASLAGKLMVAGNSRAAQKGQTYLEALESNLADVGLGTDQMETIVMKLDNMGSAVGPSRFEEFLSPQVAMENPATFKAALDAVAVRLFIGSESSQQRAEVILASTLQSARTSRNDVLVEEVVHSIGTSVQASASQPVGRTLSSFTALDDLLVETFYSTPTLSTGHKEHLLSYFQHKVTREASQVRRLLGEELAGADFTRHPELDTLGHSHLARTVLSAKPKEHVYHRLQSHKAKGRKLMDDWDSTAPQYNVVQDLATRTQDKTNYPQYKHFLWGSRIGVDDIHADVALGAFAGVKLDENPVCSDGMKDFKMFAAGGLKVKVFSYEQTVADARAYSYKRDGTLKAHVSVKFMGEYKFKKEAQSSTVFQVKEDLFDPVHHQLFSKRVARIPCGPFTIDISVDVSFTMSMKIEWTVDLDQGYVEALLTPQPGVIAAVSGGVSLGGVIGAGVECEVTIGYKLIPKATIGLFDPDAGGSEYGTSCYACVSADHEMPPVKVKLKGYVTASIDPCFGVFGGCKISKTWKFNIYSWSIGGFGPDNLFRICYDLCEGLTPLPPKLSDTQTAPELEYPQWQQTTFGLADLRVDNSDPSRLHFSFKNQVDRSGVIDFPATTWKACITPWHDSNTCKSKTAAGGQSDTNVNFEWTLPEEVQGPDFRKTFVVVLQGCNNICGCNEEIFFPMSNSWCLNAETGVTRNRPPAPNSMTQVIEPPQVVLGDPSARLDSTLSIDASTSPAQITEYGIDKYSFCLAFGPETECSSEECWRGCVESIDGKYTWEGRLNDPESLRMKENILRTTFAFDPFKVISKTKLQFVSSLGRRLLSPDRVSTVNKIGWKAEANGSPELPLISSYLNPNLNFFSGAFGLEDSEYKHYWDSISPKRIFRVKGKSHNTCGWSKDSDVLHASTWGCLVEGATSYAEENMILPAKPTLSFVERENVHHPTWVRVKIESNTPTDEFKEDETEWCREKLDWDPSDPDFSVFAATLSEVGKTAPLSSRSCLTTTKRTATLPDGQQLFGFYNLVTTTHLEDLDPHFYYVVTARTKTECGWSPRARIVVSTVNCLPPPTPNPTRFPTRFPTQVPTKAPTFNFPVIPSIVIPTMGPLLGRRRLQGIFSPSQLTLPPVSIPIYTDTSKEIVPRFSCGLGGASCPIATAEYGQDRKTNEWQARAVWQNATDMTYPQMSPFYEACLVYPTLQVNEFTTVKVDCQKFRSKSNVASFVMSEEPISDEVYLWVSASSTCGDASFGDKTKPLFQSTKDPTSMYQNLIKAELKQEVGWYDNFYSTRILPDSNRGVYFGGNNFEGGTTRGVPTPLPTTIPSRAPSSRPTLSPTLVAGPTESPVALSGPPLTEDSKRCSDGTFVSRDHSDPSCPFLPCPVQECDFDHLICEDGTVLIPDASNGCLFAECPPTPPPTPSIDITAQPTDAAPPPTAFPTNGKIVLSGSPFIAPSAQATAALSLAGLAAVFFGV